MRKKVFKTSSASTAFDEAEKLQAYAKERNFDWPDIEGIWNKIYEEIEEVKVEIQKYKESPVKKNKDLLENEIGDLLFSCVNLARRFHINSEKALIKTNHKFRDRFRWVETQIQNKSELSTETPYPMEVLTQLWEESKKITLKNEV